MKTAYEHGYDARLRSCHRVLCNPKGDEELREWQRGWDDADLMARLERPGNCQQVSIPRAIDT